MPSNNYNSKLPLININGVASYNPMGEINLNYNKPINSRFIKLDNEKEHSLK